MRTNLMRTLFTALLVTATPLAGCATMSAEMADRENTKAQRNEVWAALNQWRLLTTGKAFAIDTPAKHVASIVWNLTRTGKNIAVSFPAEMPVKLQAMLRPELAEKVRKNGVALFLRKTTAYMTEDEKQKLDETTSRGTQRQILDMMEVVVQNDLRAGGLLYGILLDERRMALLILGRPIPLE